MENPIGIQLAQWLNEPTHHGFISKTFQLTDEPIPGKWYIRMKRGEDEITSRSFLVENYVLPKFSVTISGPESIHSSGTIMVCAK